MGQSWAVASAGPAPAALHMDHGLRLGVPHCTLAKGGTMVEKHVSASAAGWEVNESMGNGEIPLAWNTTVADFVSNV